MRESTKTEVIIKLVGRLSLEFPDIDQLKVREIAEEVLYKYDVFPQETGLITTDVEEKLQLYLAVKKMDGLSPKTLKNYNYNLLIFASYIRKPLATVTAMDLRVYLAQRCKEMKPGSVNAQIYILKSFFSWLYAEEYIPKNPTLKLKATKEPKRVRKPLTDEEIELLRQACKTDREKALIEFLVSTGCRLSEVTGINIEDMDWYEMSLHVIGKGNKERKVFFNVKAKILLQKYLNTRKDSNPALFVTSRRPYNRLGNRSVEREVEKIAKRAGFNKSVYPHLFRHSYASHNINAGMPLHILQKLMGHESADTTLIYAEISDDNIKHEYNRLT